ncbi:MAG TPA: hypothetical protein VNZ52_10045 [Candidatus Thermoplasmatota archaeon]|nr:hypothetical protein [Candidatus Thermoplasmatota archaeon]
MVTTVRRLDGDRIEVMFGKPVSPEGRPGQALTTLAAEGNMFLIKSPEGILGVETTEKDYVRFLQAIDSSRETITNFRRSLDDSKKAVRERQRR